MCCTATGNSGHSLRQDCGIISIYLKGVSDGGPNENEETSLLSLKPKLFLKHSAVKVHKRKCVADTTSAMNNFHGVEVSVARKGCPWENGYAERLIRTLKEEEVHLNAYEDIYEAKPALGILLHKCIITNARTLRWGI